MKPVFLYRNPKTKLFIVQLPEEWDWKKIDAKWMDDDLLGEEPEIPSIDIVQMEASFKVEEEALKFIAHLYQWQLQQL